MATSSFALQLCLLAACAAGSSAAAAGSSAAAAPIPVDIAVDTTVAPTPFPHFWKTTFGSGHARLTLREDWQLHLKQARDELGLGGVRYHGIFDDDMGVVTGHRQYNWTLIDASWDYQVGLGLTPVVELSFMPAILAGCSWPNSPGVSPGGAPVNPGKAKCNTIMHYQGVKEPPKEFEDWYHLVNSLGQHAVQRYGVANVSKWNFEVWNEMWGMTFPEPYMTLFNASSKALKDVHSSLRVGGPATMQLLNVEDFIVAADAKAIGYDFISTHMYPTDPQCSRAAKPGEAPPAWRPDCFTEHVKNASKLAKAAGKPFYMTEYNVGCCPDTQSDDSGSAAFAFQEFGQLSGHTDILSWWTFSDVFEEGGLPKTEFRNEFGMKTLHGIPKPAWRAFQLAHEHAGTQRLPLAIKEHRPPPPPPTPPPPPPPPGACAVKKSKRCFGDDILPGTQHLMLPSADACCKACWNHTTPLQCSAWTYGGKTAPAGTAGRCYLKTSLEGCKSDPAFTSGETHAVAPAKPYDGDAISGFATTKGEETAVFLGYWSNAPGHAGTGDHSITLTGNPKKKWTTATEYRIDEHHANPAAAWRAMGSPAVPSAAQITSLTAASVVAPTALTLSADNAVTLTMANNSAVCIVFKSDDRAASGIREILEDNLAKLKSAKYTVELSATTAPAPFMHWEECDGSGHASLTLRADWRAHLTKARRDLGVKRTRFRGLLDDDFSISLGPSKCPPWSMNCTSSIIVRMGVHLKQRYPKKKKMFEVWNEPNGGFWQPGNNTDPVGPDVIGSSMPLKQS